MTTKKTSQRKLLLRSPRMAVETIRGLLGWACEEWAQKSGDAAEVTIEVRLAPGTLDLSAMCWVLAHTPGCTNAALSAALERDFTGAAVRTLQQLDVPPPSDVLMRCMTGVVKHLEHQEYLRGLLDLGAAAIQTGLDINEAVATGDRDSANYFRSSARVVRGCLAAVVPLRPTSGA